MSLIFFDKRTRSCSDNIWYGFLLSFFSMMKKRGILENVLINGCHVEIRRKLSWWFREKKFLFFKLILKLFCFWKKSKFIVLDYFYRNWVKSLASFGLISTNIFYFQFSMTTFLENVVPVREKWKKIFENLLHKDLLIFLIK